jgi:hypothetical protein
MRGSFVPRSQVTASGWSRAGSSGGRDDYLRELQAADEPRRGDLDGRGNLSDEGLAGFYKFFLETALDQVRFMAGLLELDGLLLRVSKYVELRATRNELEPEARFLLEVLLRGEVARGEVSRITGLGERTGRTLLS